MNSLFFIVVCEETDMFDGKVVHLNEKAKDLEEVHQIVSSSLNKYPTAHWELFPCHIKM